MNLTKYNPMPEQNCNTKCNKMYQTQNNKESAKPIYSIFLSSSLFLSTFSMSSFFASLFSVSPASEIFLSSIVVFIFSALSPYCVIIIEVEKYQLHIYPFILMGAEQKR